jgi:hypothetical protein
LQDDGIGEDFLDYCQSPCIDIQKTVDCNGDGNFSDQEMWYAGDNATWKVVVTNCGSCNLTNVTVSDTNGHDFGLPFDLPYGGPPQEFTYQTIVSVNTTNNATVTAMDPVGFTVSDWDIATNNVITPDICVEKTVDCNGDDTFSDEETWYAGDNAAWKVIVSNCGDSDLFDIVVTDDNGYDFGLPFDLAAGADPVEFTYYTHVDVDTTNVAYVVGYDELGGDWYDEDGATNLVITPEICIEKTVDCNNDGIFKHVDVGYAGDNATWKVVVTNCRDSDLFDIVVTDDNGHDFSPAFNLTVGENKTFTYQTRVDVDTTNVAYVVGYDELGGAWYDNDDATNLVISPDICVEKTVDCNDDGIFLDEDLGYAGDTGHWKVVVTNCGDSDLTNVTISDTNGHDFGAPFDLPYGALPVEFNYDTVVSVNTTNNVTVSATDLLGGTVSDWDIATNNVISPSINIAKTVDFDGDGVYGELETNYAGQTAHWKVVVCNNGTSPVYNITVTDTNLHDFSPAFDLAVSDCKTFDYDLVMNADTVNNATAQGKDELGGTVGPVWDTAAVHVISPSISIAKTVDFNGDGVYGELETNDAGKNASWKVVVCNIGHDPVYDIVVTDTNGHDFGATFNLTAGECVTFTYNMTMFVDTVNNATAQGKDELGGTVGPVWDTAAVKIKTELPCPAGFFDFKMDGSGNLNIVYDQFPAPNDNSYGANAVGWGTKGHTFDNLVGSDHAGFQLIDPSGVVKLSFNIDYISTKTGTNSGYASLGPFGGDGDVVVGPLLPGDISFDTSLARNLNNMGYFSGGVQTLGTLAIANLLVNSPPTLDPSGLTPNAYVLTPAAAAVFTAPNPDSPDSPGWNFHDTYFVTINAAKLAALGFDINTWKVEPNLDALHNSPAKPCPTEPCVVNQAPTLTVVPDGSGGVWITYLQSYNLNDNSYGANAVGWGTKGHTFGNLVGSDKAQFIIKDNSGNTVMNFYFDYISAKSGTPSGYDTLGVTGGEGAISVGSAAWVMSDSTTSFAVDLNRLGYFSGGVCNVTGGTNLLVDSPPTTGPLSYVFANPADFPNGWDFNDTYYVHISAAAFGGNDPSLYTVTVPSVHNSPAKVCQPDLPPAPPSSPAFNQLPPVPPPPLPGQNITVGPITVKDRDVKIKLTNTNLTAKATIYSINITWPASNGQLQQIKLGGSVIYDNPDISGPSANITIFKGNLNDRSIDKGHTDELKFHFQNNAALTGYKITVDFGPAGSVTINIP